MTTTWHAPLDALHRYAVDPCAIDESAASSIEAHVISCADCRREISRAALAADPARHASSWHAVADKVDRPRPSWAERALRLVVPEHMSRLVAATPALRVAWLLSVSALIALVVMLARDVDNISAFLVIAPIIPLAGVAVAFGGTPEPAGEAAVATPLHGAGLMLRRVIAVVGTSLVPLVLGTLALPGLQLRQAAWVLPALALSIGAIALSTWIHPIRAATGLFVVWLSVVSMVAMETPHREALAQTELFGPAGQLSIALAAAAAAAVALSRRSELTTLETR